MVRLVPHSLKIVALEDLAGRCTSVLAKNIEMPKSLCNGLRDGLGRSRRAQVVPVHLAHRGDRGIRIDPLQCQAPPLYEVVLDMAPRLRAALPAAGIDPAAVDQLVGLLRSLHAGNNDRRAGVNDLVYVVMRGWADVLRRARVARGSDRAAEDAYHELIKRVPRLPAARLGSDPHLLELRRALAMNGGLGMGGGLAVPPMWRFTRGLESAYLSTHWHCIGSGFILGRQVAALHRAAGLAIVGLSSFSDTERLGWLIYYLSPMPPSPAACR